MECKKLEEKLEGQRLITYMIAHDMRFPVASILHAFKKIIE